MNVRVIAGLDGSVLTQCQIDEKGTARHVKEILARRCQVSMSEQRLMHDTKILNDDFVLSDLPRDAPSSTPDSVQDTVFFATPDLTLSLLRVRRNRLLATGAEDGALRFVHLDEPIEPKVLRGHPSSMLCLCVDWEAQMAMSGANDGSINFWDVARLKLLTQFGLKGHRGQVRSVDMDFENHRAVSGGIDGPVLLWDCGRGELLSQHQGHKNAVWGLHICPGETRFISGGGDGFLRMLDWTTDEMIWQLLDATHSIRCMDFDPDSNCILTGACDGTLKLWMDGAIDLEACFEKTKLWSAEERHLTQGITCMAVYWGRWHAFVGSLDHFVRWWSLKTFEMLRVLQTPTVVRCIQADHLASILVCAGEQGFTKVWDYRKDLHEELDPHDGTVYCLSASWLSSKAENPPSPTAVAKARIAQVAREQKAEQKEHAAVNKLQGVVGAFVHLRSLHHLCVATAVAEEHRTLAPGCTCGTCAPWDEYKMPRLSQCTLCSATEPLSSVGT